MLSFHQFKEPPEYQGISEPLFQLYRQRTAQCLIIGDIAKCLPYTLETLRFNATAEHNRTEDNSRGLWIMTGVLIRVAINMGYHRELSSSSPISILQAEYRRRVWLSVISIDDVASFNKGFPRMLPEVYSNATEPRNLHDWELSGETTVLPSSRPMTESTPVTYMILKGRLFAALGRITDFNNLPNSGPYNTVLEIDSALHEAYQSFPTHLRMSGGTNVFNTQTAKSDLSSLQLESMYHQGMCTLHRRFLAKGRLYPQYNISRDRCITSALALLGCQEFLKPSWYKMSQTRQMISLAAMILFLELEQRRVSRELNTPGGEALFMALKKSCSFWNNAKDSCAEAREFYQFLAGLLSGFQSVFDTGNWTQTPNEELSESPEVRTLFQPSNGPASWGGDWFEVTDDMSLDWVSSSSLLLASRFQCIKC